MLETPPQISTKQDLFVHMDLLQDTARFLRVPLIKVGQSWALVMPVSQMNALIAFIAVRNSAAWSIF